MASYGTVEQLTIRIGLLSTLSAAQETMLDEILEATSRCIDRICGRPDDDFIESSEAETRYFPAGGEAYLEIPRCTDITEVAVKASVTATTYTAWEAPTTPMAGDGDWVPCTGDPESPTFSQLPYTLIILDPNGDYTYFLDGDDAPVCMVTAKWSSQVAVPGDIREACLMQAARWFKQFQGSMASELGVPDLGQITYRRALDSNVKQILIDGGWVLPLYGGR